MWSGAVASLLLITTELNCLDATHQQFPEENLRHVTHIEHALKKFLPADVTTWHENSEPVCGVSEVTSYSHTMPCK